MIRITIGEERKRVKQVKNKITEVQMDIANILVNSNSNFKNIVFISSDRKIYFDIGDDSYVLELHMQKKDDFEVIL